jgi:octopine/nopaline transport system permease protein
MEVTGIAQGLISQSYRAIEVFIAAGAIYLFINFLIVRALAYLEIRMTPYRSHG